jgi:cell division protein FtsQ
VTGVPARRRIRPTARAAVLRAPQRGAARVALPSGRSVVAGLALLAGAMLLYGAARETSVFAVRQIEITGASPRVERAARKALADERGVSLVKIDPAVVASSLVQRVPEVESASVDRAFPNTLAVRIRAERPVAVLRRGAESWVVSARGRVLRAIPRGALLSLPRIWLGRGASPEVGERVDEESGARAVAALAPLRGFGLHPRYVRTSEDEVTLVLRTGLELRLGDTGDLRLKFSIARRVLLTLGETGRGAYVDVSVPQRPVAAANPQVGD